MSQTQKTAAVANPLLSQFIDIQNWLGKEILGQYELVERLLIALLGMGTYWLKVLLV